GAGLQRLDVNGAPTDLELDSDSIDENVSANTVVGNFTSTDPDSGNTFTYSLVSGPGSTDNGAFTIVGNALQINASPDFEAKNSYSIRVKTTDQGGLFFEKELTISINNLDEVAPEITSGTIAPAIDENSGAGQIIYTVEADDSQDISAGIT
ncbi:cadherin repeat domain-containing protein, partial [Synechocystis salina LEGE 06155]|nr:cadherin repeat domain-containing protein [Synechocystis salina LEGE 06155]